jgi:DNA-binding HxlR family transcriptional regulator
MAGKRGQKEDENEIITDVKFYCPLRITACALNGKYKPAILYYLRKGPLRFSQIKRRITTVTKKMLTQQLRALEADKLIDRHVYAEIPAKVEYSLTEHGKALLPLLELMIEWGMKYYEATGKLADF